MVFMLKIDYFIVKYLSQELENQGKTKNNTSQIYIFFFFFLRRYAYDTCLFRNGQLTIPVSMR